MTDRAHCCFCLEVSPQAEMYFVNLWPPGSLDDERTQQMFCHGACLARALHPAFPGHPDLPDAEPVA
jgi:hypothetical protein